MSLSQKSFSIVLFKTKHNEPHKRVSREQNNLTAILWRIECTYIFMYELVPRTKSKSLHFSAEHVARARINMITSITLIANIIAWPPIVHRIDGFLIVDRLG